jgi:hypothetical protein
MVRGSARMHRVCVRVVTAATLVAAPASAEQLGVDLVSGPVIASHGALGADVDPIMTGRVVAIYHTRRWAVEGGVWFLANTSRESARPGLGITGGIRGYEPFAGGIRNGVRWRFAGFASAGWSQLAVTYDPPSPHGSTTLARSTRANAWESVDGPRTGLGIEMSLSRDLVWSRITLDATYQVLSARTEETRGGYTSLQLGFATSVGR